MALGKSLKKKKPRTNYRHTYREVTNLNEPAIKGFRVDGPWSKCEALLLN